MNSIGSKKCGPHWSPGKNLNRVVILFAVLVIPANNATAEQFAYSVNLYGNWSEYLESSNNAEVYTEQVAGHSTYWRSTPINTWGEVIYQFPLSFEIRHARLETMIVAYTADEFGSWADPGAMAYLDVSPDGNNWTTVMESYPGNGGYRDGPGDITPIVLGSTEVYVRARLYSTRNWPTDGPIFAQFMRTNPGDGDFPRLTFTASDSDYAVVPDSLLVTHGSYVSGDQFSLAESDNIDLIVRRLGTDIQSRTEFEVVGTSPSADPSSLEVTLEGAAFARSSVVQTIELFDYAADQWEQVDFREAPSFTDSTVTVPAKGDLSRFVELGTFSMKARIRYQSLDSRQRFSSNTDQFMWLVGP